MEATFWALLPPILAIVASLLTKEVNLSLLVGILVGAGLYCNFNPFSSLTTVFDIMSAKISGNLCVLIFLILLGMIVFLMNLSGATHEYAKWASRKLKTKKQTALATMALGVVIFVDDYFNCLTVGTVMRPISDRNRISREKLAYIIDSTAAPVCIISPISSWAAAVSSSLPDGSKIDGFQLFLKSITSNFYPWLSLGMVFLVIILNADFGKMRKCEIEASNRAECLNEGTDKKEAHNGRGKVIDLILPVIALIVLSLISILYTGGLFDGKSIAVAFANCNAFVGLALGAAYTVLFVALLYLPRKIVTGKQFIDGLMEGFKNMVPTALILTFAWTLSGICGNDYLNAGGFVSHIVTTYNIDLNLMPAIFFIVSLLLAFATGTSWGTFAILLPIIISVFADTITPLTILTTSAVLGGSVCGDHISPISDTTILSSTGAKCGHIDHVSTQMQYGLVVAGISFICYIVSGFTKNIALGMGLGVILLVAFILCVKKFYANKE